jgi:hypothetical protein
VQDCFFVGHKTTKTLFIRSTNLGLESLMTEVKLSQVITRGCIESFRSAYLGSLNCKVSPTDTTS